MVETYLHSLYHQTQINLAKTNFSQTQGEILYPSITKLLSHLQLTTEDSFVDLGSGCGKIVSQVFLTSLVKTAGGIEIIPELHQIALKIADKIKLDFPDSFARDRQLNFFLGNFLEIPFTTATVVLINAVCFSPGLLQTIGEVFNNTPSIHTVLSLRPIHSLTRLVFQKTIHIQCSWDSALCYIYQ